MAKASRPFKEFPILVPADVELAASPASGAQGDPEPDPPGVTPPGNDPRDAVIAEMRRELDGMKAQLAAKSDAPIQEPPAEQRPEYAPVEQTAPLNYARGERGYIVSLKHSPEAFVAEREAADRLDAIEVYKRRMGIRSSTHPFQVRSAVYGM